MSTDIVHFTDNQGTQDQTFEPAALKLFFEISIPLLVLTFMAWYGVYWWETGKEKRRRKQDPSSFKV